MNNRDSFLNLLEKYNKPCRVALKCAFLWPGAKSFFIDCLWLFMLFATSINIGFQLVFLYFNWKDMELLIGTISTMSMMVQLFYKSIILRYHKKRAARMLKVVKDEFWPLEQAENYESIVKYMHYAQLTLYNYFSSCFIVSQIWMINPYVKALPGQRQMPILSWYPFDVNVSPQHELAYVFIYFMCFYMVLVVVGFDSLFTFFMQQLIAQFKVLKFVLSTINNEINDGYENDSEKAKLRLCIDHHNRLLRFCDDIEIVYGVQIGIQLLSSGLIFCVLGFLATIEEDLEKLFKLFGFMVCMMIQLSLYCIQGSELKQETITVADAAYENGWWHSSPSFKRSLSFMIMRSQRPQSFKALGFIELNNATLIMVLRTAFSFVTLLKNIDE